MSKSTSEEKRQFFAFISYSSRDTKWGKRLQRRLEGYRLPTTLCREKGFDRNPMKPVFFAVTDIQPGVLSDELKSRLQRSRNLIVIGSPSSAGSEWVGKEIEYFCKDLGRADRLYYFIVDGEPNNSDPSRECFHPILAELGLPEQLGVNIREGNYRLPMLNRDRAYIQLISKLLGLEFDTLWRREVRRRIRNAILWAIGILAVIAALIGVWYSTRSVDVDVRLSEPEGINASLPAMQEGVVTLQIGKELKRDSLSADKPATLFRNIPQSYIGKEVRFSFSAPNYLSLDTTIRLGRENVIPIKRDPQVFGHIQFRIWDSDRCEDVKNMDVTINGRQVKSNVQGEYETNIPLEEQRRYYIVKSPRRLDNDTLFMPTGTSSKLFLE